MRVIHVCKFKVNGRRNKFDSSFPVLLKSKCALLSDCGKHMEYIQYEVCSVFSEAIKFRLLKSLRRDVTIKIEFRQKVIDASCIRIWPDSLEGATSAKYPAYLMEYTRFAREGFTRQNTPYICITYVVMICIVCIFSG